MDTTSTPERGQQTPSRRSLMATRNVQNTDILLDKVDNIPIDTARDIARAMPLYIKVVNDRGVVRNVSSAYIDGYTGASFYKKFSKYLEQMCAMFSRSGMLGTDVRVVFKRVAGRVTRIPTSVKEMDILKGVVFEEIQRWIRTRRMALKRETLVTRFKTAVKHYLNMTYELGFNEPSECAKTLAETHKIDKYIMAGDFAVMLLPFLPEIEDIIRKNYEHYEMQDAWENLKGRYFNHKADYMNMALEIKSPNFSRYFDELYTNTYYKMMLKRGKTT